MEPDTPAPSGGNFAQLRAAVEAKEARVQALRAMTAAHYIRQAGRDPEDSMGKLLSEKFLADTRDTEPADLDAAWSTFADTYGIGPAEPAPVAEDEAFAGYVVRDGKVVTR